MFSGDIEMKFTWSADTLLKLDSKSGAFSVLLKYNISMEQKNVFSSWKWQILIVWGKVFSFAGIVKVKIENEK